MPTPSQALEMMPMPAVWAAARMAAMRSRWPRVGWAMALGQRCRRCQKGWLGSGQTEAAKFFVGAFDEGGVAEIEDAGVHTTAEEDANYATVFRGAVGIFLMGKGTGKDRGLRWLGQQIRRPRVWR